MSYFIMVTPQLFDFSVSPIVYTVNYSIYYGMKAKTMLHTQILFLLLKWNVDYMTQICNFMNEW